MAGGGFMTAFQGVVHGKTIELEQELGLAEGQRVAVAVRIVDEPPAWLGRLVVDPAVNPGTLVIQGTRLLVDDLVRLAEEHRNDRELSQLHPELTPADLEAIRQYARVPAGLRQSFGGWAEDAEELDEYLKWTRQQRKTRRREVEE